MPFFYGHSRSKSSRPHHSEVLRNELTRLIGLDRWTEVVGTVNELVEDTVVVSSSQRFVVHLREEDSVKLSTLLHKGSRVGILLLDDLSIRLRILDDDAVES